MLALILFLALIVIPFFINRTRSAPSSGISKLYHFLTIVSGLGLYALITAEYKTFVWRHFVFFNILFFIAFFFLWIIPFFEIERKK